MPFIYANLPHLARDLIGFYFIFFGVWNIYHWYSIMETMSEKGIPHPYLVLPFGILWQTVAGIMIMGGLFVKLAAFSLIPFTLISIFLFHPFWQFRGEHRILHFTIFWINLTVTIGALILLMSPLNQYSDLFFLAAKN